MFDVQEMFSALVEHLRARRLAIEASLSTGTIEHWLATECAILLHSNRERFGISGETIHEGLGGIRVPRWWVAREARSVDLWIEDTSGPQKTAIEFKVIWSNGADFRERMDRLWNQISPDRAEFHIERWGIVLAYYLVFGEGQSKYRQVGGKRNPLTPEAFFEAVTGPENTTYEDWKVVRSEVICDLASRETLAPYIAPNSGSQVQLFLIAGKNAKISAE